MLTCIISAILLAYPSAITSEEEWCAPGISVTEEWSLDVMNRIDPAFRHLGDVYGVESEDGFSWHTVLVAKGYVLHFRDDVLIDSLTYEGDIDYIKFSANHRYLLGYSGTDNTMKLFDLIESTVVYQLVFSHDMGLLSEPSFRLADDGRIIAKHSTYLRIYDSDLDVVLSEDDFEWGGRFIGMTHDGSRMYACNDNSIKVLNANAEYSGRFDLPESEGEIALRNYAVSNTGQYIAVTDQSILYLYDARSGSRISEYSFETLLRDPVFSSDDKHLLVGTFTVPELTPLRPENGFGLALLSFMDSDLSLVSEYYSPGLSGELPSFFSDYMVSTNAYSIGFLYYFPSFVRIVLLSDELEMLWLSGDASIPPYNAWFINHQQGINPDGSRLWFFDGQLLHFCIAEGV
jgi:hypothetical protein